MNSNWCVRKTDHLLLNSTAAREKLTQQKRLNDLHAEFNPNNNNHKKVSNGKKRKLKSLSLGIYLQ